MWSYLVGSAFLTRGVYFQRCLDGLAGNSKILLGLSGIFCLNLVSWL